jgi:hypothetical protein
MIRGAIRLKRTRFAFIAILLLLLTAVGAKLTAAHHDVLAADNAVRLYADNQVAVAGTVLETNFPASK